MVTTVDQCALSGESDYTAQVKMEYTFVTGEATLNIPVTIVDDDLVEEKEQFLVKFEIKNPTPGDVYGEVDKAIVVIFSEDIGRHFQV